MSGSGDGPYLQQGIDTNGAEWNFSGEMSTFLYHTFTAADGTALTSLTPEIGGAYSIHPSGTNSPVVTANRARSTSATSWVYNAASPPTADYVVETLMRQVTDEAANAGIQARLSISADTYYIARYDMNADQIQLRKVTAGTSVDIGNSPVSLVLNNGDDLFLRFVCCDDRKEVWANGTRVITSTDNEITAKGVVGMRFTSVTDGATQGLHLDYILASSTGSNLRNPTLRPYVFAPGLAR